MTEDAEIKNRIAESGLVTLNLEEFYHTGERILFDIKSWLFREQILKEKDFREQVKNHDWAHYQNKNIAFTCSVDAIVPTWAYMLLATAVQPYANRFVFGDLNLLETILFNDAIAKIPAEKYRDARVIIKGCGDLEVPVSAYVEISNKLLPHVKTLLYGEACSNVPVYKKKTDVNP